MKKAILQMQPQPISWWQKVYWCPFSLGKFINGSWPI